MSAIIYPGPVKPYLGKGSVLFDRYDDTTLRPTGSLLHMGNVTKFDTESKDDLATQYSSMNAASSILARALKKREPTLSIVGTDFGPEKRAIIAMATGITTLATSAATVTAEVLATAAVPKKGRFFRAANRNIDNATVIPVLTGGTTPAPLVLGVDYDVIDAPRGIFYIRPGATTVGIETAQITITYHTLVGAVTKIAALVKPTVTCYVHFDSDPTDGPKRDVDVWKVSFSPTGPDSLIADDYGNWQLDGAILDDSANHPTAPFYEETQW